MSWPASGALSSSEPVPARLAGSVWKALVAIGLEGGVVIQVPGARGTWIPPGPHRAGGPLP